MRCGCELSAEAALFNNTIDDPNAARPRVFFSSRLRFISVILSCSLLLLPEAVRGAVAKALQDFYLKQLLGSLIACSFVRLC